MSPMALSAIGVRTQPGATQFTRPRGAIFTISFLRESSSPPISADLVHA